MSENRSDIRQLARRDALRWMGLSPLAFQLSGTTTSADDRASARACIFLHMTGGPAQQETFDMKPDATGHARGEFNPIRSSVPGLDVCEFMPHTTRVAQHLAVIRSMHHDSTFHGAGTHLNLTGFPHHTRTPTPEFYLDRRDAPSIGAVIQHLHGRRTGLPAAVQLPYWIQQGNVGRFAGQDAGFLGRQCDPLRVFYESKEDLPGQFPPAFQLHGDVAASRLADRSRLLDGLNAEAIYDRDLPQWRRDRERALEILHSSGSWKALSIEDEQLATVERYGDSKFGRSCLVARRLVEAGVKFVTVCWPGHESHFDTHANHFDDMKKVLLPTMDQAYAALLRDLHDRGLLDETLVVWSGEFGRTPAMNGNNKPGRDHWPWVYTSVLAGGGIAGGQVYGSSDEHAAYPNTDAVHVTDFVATIYHALGYDSATIVRDQQDRPHHVVQGKPLTRLFQS